MAGLIRSLWRGWARRAGAPAIGRPSHRSICVRPTRPRRALRHRWRH